MPNVPDGSVIIETDLNTEKVSGSVGQLEKLLKGLIKSVDSLTKAINAQFNETAKSVDNAKASAEELNKELDKTPQKRSTEVDVDVDASEIDAISRKDVDLKVDVNADTADLNAGVGKMSDGFTVATDSLGLLEQKFSNINRQITEQQNKVSALEKEYQSAVNAGASEDTLSGISGKITAAQAKLIGLQETANKTSDRIAKIKAAAEKQDIEIEVTADTSQAEKAVNKSSNQIINNSNKTAGEITKRSSETGQKVKHDFEDAGSRSSASLDSLADRAKAAFGKLTTAMAAAFSIKTVVDFGKSAVSASNEAANALQGLQSIMEGQGRSFGNATDWIQDYISDGLIPMQNAVTAYKNLAARGYDDTQIQNVLTALKDSSAYGRQSSYSMGEAVQTATEGLKNENSILVDNAGVTKNVAKMWDDYAASIGTTSAKLTQEQKIQAEVNGIIEETKFQQGDAAKISEGFSGQLSRLSYAFNELKVTVGNVLTQALTPIIKVLGEGIAKLTGFVKQLSELIGVNTDTLNSGAAESASSVAESTSEVAENYADAAESAEAAAEANENQLASFDKINKLGESSDDAADTASSNEPASNSSGGAAVLSVDVDTDGAENKLSSLLDSIKSTFESAGEYIKKNFGGIFAGIWDGLTAEFAELKLTFSTITRDLKTLAEPLKQYFTGDFTVWMQTVFSTLGNIATGTFDTFNTVFSDLWNVAIFPILEKFVTEGLPMLTQFSTQAWETTGTAFSAVREIFDTLWSEAVCPVLGFITQAWCDMVDTISAFWNEWGTPIFEGIREAINSTKDIFLNVWETILRPIFDSIMEVVDRVWTEHLQPLIAEFLDFVGELVTGATDIYNKFIAPIVNWLVDTLGPVVQKTLSTVVETVGAVVGNIIDVVKGVITQLKGIVQFLTGIFTGNWRKAWEGIKNIFKGIWDSFVSLAKAPINLIIGVINKFTGAVEDALNWVIDGINSISIDLPEAVADIVGFDSIGFDLSNVNIPDIPYLATGTVVPANYGEFLAVLGDNKREAEVVSPVSTMRQAMLEALAAYGGMDGNSRPVSLTVPVSVDGRVLMQVTVDNINDYIRRNGKSPIMA